MRSKCFCLLLCLALTIAIGAPIASAQLPGDIAWSDCRYLPAAARTIGYNDAYYTTDLDLVNTGAELSRVGIILLTRDADNTESPLWSEIEPLPAGASTTLEDVVSYVLDVQWQDWMGGLLVCSEHPGIEAFSRIYHTDEAGTTYGQGLAGLTLEDAIGPGEVGHLLALRQDERFRTNLGLMNPGETQIEVFLSLKDVDGNLINRIALDLGGYSQIQFNRFLSRFGTPGLTEGRVEITSPDGPVFVYGSKIDRVTNDPTLIQPVGE
jgi:hypothetical protein